MNHAVTLELEHHTNPRSAKIGMWLFLYTELLLFGGMFLLYAVYRTKFPLDFHYAATDLNTLIGTINTIILLTSSLTMALSIATLERGNKRLSVIFLAITILFGILFLVNKYFEWKVKFEHGIYPGSPELENHKSGEILFYGLYFVMTGLHGIHVLVGVIALGVMLAFIVKNPYEKIAILPHHLRHIPDTRLCILNQQGGIVWDGGKIDDSMKQISIKLAYDDSRMEKINHSDLIKLENCGLYWHLVDLIWIFLFPLFYLIT